MTRLRISLLTLFGCLCFASSVRADIPGPDGKATRHPWGYGAPPPGWLEIEKQMEAIRQSAEKNAAPTPPPPPEGLETTPNPSPNPPPPVKDTPQPPPPPPARAVPARQRRTGPFRSCGSGMGVGLAGIGLTWGLMWIGHRYAGRVARTRREDQRNGGDA